jgi:hypothetical protein
MWYATPWSRPHPRTPFGVAADTTDAEQSIRSFLWRLVARGYEPAMLRSLFLETLHAQSHQPNRNDRSYDDEAKVKPCLLGFKWCDPLMYGIIILCFTYFCSSLLLVLLYS